MPIPSRLPVVTAVIASLAIPLPQVVNAQAPGGVVYTVVLPAGQFGSQAFTNVLVGGLAAAQKFCGGLGKEYRADCLAERLGVLANQVPEGSDYTEVQDALNDASKRIESLARSNRDRTLPRGKATSPTSGQSTTRPLSPIASESLESVNRQAIAILDETQTLLLRSADAAEGKQVHYQRIADALGSNKVLLRSA